VALYRLCELSDGAISIDGVDIASIGLDALRSSIAIIPQDPVLFSGDLRSNLDSFGVYTDAELYDAMKRAHLPERFKLDTAIADEGSNLSVGERSLVSLARALVKKVISPCSAHIIFWLPRSRTPAPSPTSTSKVAQLTYTQAKIVLLDEATAAVDLETDARIQNTIAAEFSDRTLICIAHRLRTILSWDRILVMDAGRVAEFDTPARLFRAKGQFYEMCVASGISHDEVVR
jgi:ABC-type multidrug transport system fused ATPase/permease subunit